MFLIIHSKNICELDWSNVFFLILSLVIFFLFLDVVPDWGFVDGGQIEPSDVVGSLIWPLLFDFVASSPHEGGVVVVVECAHYAGGDFFHLGVVEMGRVGPALALINSHLRQVERAIRGRPLSGPVEISRAGRILNVCFRAFDWLAFVLWLHWAVVEATKPVSTVVGCESPFSFPNFVFASVLVNNKCIFFPIVTIFLDFLLAPIPSHIAMMVQGY